MKKQLTEKFGKDGTPVDASYAVNKGEVVSSPAIGEEAPDGKAKLTGSLSFTMIGVSKSEAGKFLDAYFAKEVEGKKDQRVYNNGVDKVSFVDVARTKNDVYSATMAATAKFGPKINDAEVKTQSQGKRYGDVQSSLERIPGVEDVDIKFRPFWVTTVPKDEKRISIEFKLNDSK